MHTLVRIKVIDGKPTHMEKEIILSAPQNALLIGKGEGASVLIRKEHLKYKEDENSEDNKQNSP